MNPLLTALNSNGGWGEGSLLSVHPGSGSLCSHQRGRIWHEMRREWREGGQAMNMHHIPIVTLVLSHTLFCATPHLALSQRHQHSHFTGPWRWQFAPVPDCYALVGLTEGQALLSGHTPFQEKLSDKVWSSGGRGWGEMVIGHWRQEEMKGQTRGILQEPGQEPFTEAEKK